MGGVIYRQPTELVLPKFWEEAPLERHVIEHQFWLLSEEAATKIGHRNRTFANEPYNSFTVLRAKFDRWFATKVEEEGAMIIPETTVIEPIQEDGKIVGVTTNRSKGDLYAKVVVAADGANSLLARQAGLHNEWTPQSMSLGLKEVISLEKQVINERFGIKDGEGITIEIIGDATAGLTGPGFIYTNEKSLSIGIGVLLSDLVESGMSPNDVLDRMKQHPLIQPLIDGGKTKEYSAHLVPEGYYKGIPKLYTDGLLVVGDAAMLANLIHREGSNLATTSGLLAAKTISLAREANDFSAERLSMYKHMLEESFVMKDLRKYEDLPGFFASHPELFSFYPNIANEMMAEFFKVDGVPKKEKERRVLRMLVHKRPIWRIGKDMFDLLRAVE
jgi:electron transfer flavoprotein-quinone oxidoreductase